MLNPLLRPGAGPRRKPAGKATHTLRVLATLIAMKRRTGRARDADDAEHLQWILEELEEDMEVE